MQFQKHLGVYLDGKFEFREHLKNIFKKKNKTISLLRKLQSNLPRAPLVIIYKFFISLYQELGFEFLQQRRWYRKLCFLFKIIKNLSPKYLFELIATARQAYMTRHKTVFLFLELNMTVLKILSSLQL